MLTVAPLVEKFIFPANLTQGKRLRVICTVAEGDLPLEVIWRKNGVPILINSGGQGSNVQVRMTRFRPQIRFCKLSLAFMEKIH